MQSILLIFHVLMALALIGLILIQHGKGADAGASFGGGASGTVFGSQGSGSFLTRATSILALVFFANSFFLSYLSTNQVETTSLVDQVQTVDATSEQADKIAPSNQADDVPEIETGSSDLPVIPE
jgi:preprotein translocase subunit SecG